MGPLDGPAPLPDAAGDAGLWLGAPRHRLCDRRRWVGAEGAGVRRRDARGRGAVSPAGGAAFGESALEDVEALRGAHLMPRRREGETSQHPGDGRHGRTRRAKKRPAPLLVLSAGFLLSADSLLTVLVHSVSLSLCYLLAG
jgi:hypothetical protein